jgi:antitoxin MazE
MTRLAVSKWGNSLAIRVPKHLADDLGLESGSQLSVGVENGRLIAIPLRRRPRPRLDDLVRRIKPSNRHKATDWGQPVGNEVW